MTNYLKEKSPGRIEGTFKIYPGSWKVKVKTIIFKKLKPEKHYVAEAPPPKKNPPYDEQCILYPNGFISWVICQSFGNLFGFKIHFF